MSITSPFNDPNIGPLNNSSEHNFGNDNANSLTTSDIGMVRGISSTAKETLVELHTEFLEAATSKRWEGTSHVFHTAAHLALEVGNRVNENSLLDQAGTKDIRNAIMDVALATADQLADKHYRFEEGDKVVYRFPNEALPLRTMDILPLVAYIDSRPQEKP